jgi:hypothetical protein
MAPQTKDLGFVSDAFSWFGLSKKEEIRDSEAMIESLSKMYGEEFTKDDAYTNIIKKFGEGATENNKKMRQEIMALNEKNIQEMFKGQDKSDPMIQAAMGELRVAGMKSATKAIADTKREQKSGDVTSIRKQEVEDLKKQIETAESLGQDTSAKKARLDRIIEADKPRQEARKKRQDKIKEAGGEVQKLTNKLGRIKSDQAKKMMQSYKSGMDVDEVKKMSGIASGERSDLDPLLKAMIEEEKAIAEDKKKTEAEDAPILKKRAVKKATKNREAAFKALAKGDDTSGQKAAEDIWKAVTKATGETTLMTPQQYKMEAEKYLKSQGVTEGDYSKEVAYGVAMLQENQAKSGITSQEELQDKIKEKAGTGAKDPAKVGPGFDLQEASGLNSAQLKKKRQAEFAKLNEKQQKASQALYKKFYKKGMNVKQFRAAAAEGLKAEGKDPSKFSQIANVASLAVGEKQIKAQELAKRKREKTQAFMKSVVGDPSKIKIGKGQDAEGVFRGIARQKFGAGGKKVWEDEEAYKKYKEQTDAAAKEFARQKKEEEKQKEAEKKKKEAEQGPKKGGVHRLRGKGAQQMRQSAEMQKQASAEAQASFQSQEVQAQRELAGISGGGAGGGAGGSGNATVEIVLKGAIEGQIRDLQGLNVALNSIS